MKKAVIIVAGGSGKRMNSTLPKQFLCLAGRPVLMHTIEIFHTFDATIQIIVVLPASQMDLWKQLCLQYHFTLSHQVIEGGETRFYSVKKGLDLINETCLIAVHDGVRPLASIETINRCFSSAEKEKTAIPVIALTDSLRLLENNKSISVDRTRYQLVQTPQIFYSEIIKKAYQQPYNEHFTDDASVVESMGIPIYCVAGNCENMKITTPIDLQIAETLLMNKK